MGTVSNNYNSSVEMAKKFVALTADEQIAQIGALLFAQLQLENGSRSQCEQFPKLWTAIYNAEVRPAIEKEAEAALSGPELALYVKTTNADFQHVMRKLQGLEAVCNQEVFRFLSQRDLSGALPDLRNEKLLEKWSKKMPLVDAYLRHLNVEESLKPLAEEIITQIERQPDLLGLNKTASKISKWVQQILIPIWRASIAQRFTEEELRLLNKCSSSQEWKNLVQKVQTEYSPRMASKVAAMFPGIIQTLKQQLAVDL